MDLVIAKTRDINAMFSTPTIYEHSDKNWEETLDKNQAIS